MPREEITTFLTFQVSRQTIEFARLDLERQFLAARLKELTG
jgi:hypothetical protein